MHLNHNQITNGIERIEFSGVERTTIVGNGAQFTGIHANTHEASIEAFGGNVTFTTTAPSGVSDLGSTGLRIIASEIDIGSEVRAPHIDMDSYATLDVTQRLIATQNG